MPKKSQPKTLTLPKLCNSGVYAYAYFNSRRTYAVDYFRPRNIAYGFASAGIL